MTMAACAALLRHDAIIGAEIVERRGDTPVPLGRSGRVQARHRDPDNSMIRPRSIQDGVRPMMCRGSL